MTAAQVSTKARMVDEEGASGDETTPLAGFPPIRIIRMIFYGLEVTGESRCSG
jgi:hypothetical protein